MESLTYSGRARQSIARVTTAREFLSTFVVTNELATLIDLTELHLRMKLKEFDRIETLLKRLPDIRQTRFYKMALDEHRGKKSITEDAKSLPYRTPKEKIWKHLVEASLNLESEKLALEAMHQALLIGAEVGAKETFLRQNNEMGNLIIRLANLYPTVYNEEIATAMAERIRTRGDNMNESQAGLTKRELEVLRQLSTGRTLTVISSELHISQNTMKTHLKNLYKKIGADGRHDAVDKAKALFLI